MENVGIVLSIGEAVAQAAGAPLAASLVNEIVKSCEDVARHKKSAKILGMKSRQLIVTLSEEVEGMEDDKMRERIDGVTMVLIKVRDRTRKWAGLPLAVRWWRRVDIAEGIEQLNGELDLALQEFSIKTQIANKRDQDKAAATAKRDDAENKDMLLRILANQEELKEIAKLHRDGEQIAVELMQKGQEELKELRERREPSGRLSVAETTSRSNTPDFSVVAGKRKETPRERYLEMQRGLANLHDLTGIPPAIKRLDGEIRKEGDLAVAGGPHTDIWRGRWFGQTQVALKALRSIKADDEKAQKHFIRGIEIWSRLENKHILQFYGIVTDIGTQIHVVTPWLENGNVIEYLTAHPETDKMHLVKGAAEGVRYLHSANVIHGNIKCSNILVSDSGDACISDFGMAKALEDLTRTPISTALQSGGGARWLAPEIIEGESPTTESDVYSFAMSILEMLTEKRPLAELKSDMAVIRAMAGGQIRPKRPIAPEVRRWLTDQLWALMGRCWTAPTTRPTMEDIVGHLQEM